MSLTDQVYEQIRHDILNCYLQPGQQIVQPQLMEKYRAGMTPVREALTRLAHEGLVQSVPRSGYTVSRITLSDVRELFELRAILETAAVRLAVARATDDQLRELSKRANFTYKYSNHEDYTRFLSLNQAFHCYIAGLSGNRRLAGELSRALDGLKRVFHYGLDLRDSAEEMRSEHQELVEAMLQRDAERAAAVVNQQIARSIQRVIEALTRTMGTGTAFDSNSGIQNIILGETAN